MLHTSTQKLIHKLCALTENGHIGWREAEGDVLVFDTEGYRVEIRGEPPSLRLLRNDGKELEIASAADLASTRWPEGEGTFAMRVSEMARQAQRAARGADVAISRILSSLSAPPQKPPEPLLSSLVAEGAKEPEPPPSPHTVPEPPLQPPRTETAINKLFAANPSPAPASVGAVESAPVEPEAETAVEAAEEELPLEDASEAVEPEATEPLRRPLPEPQFKVPVFAATAPSPRYAPLSRGFGAIESFAVAPWIRPQSAAEEPLPAPGPQPHTEPPTEPKVTSTGLFISSISAVTRQTARGELPQEQPAPPPASAVQTPTAFEPKAEPAPASGADIYKPWA